MKLYIVKAFGNVLDIYGHKRDAVRRVSVENRIYKDLSKLESQLQSLRVWIETSKNSPVKKKDNHIKDGRRYRIHYDLSVFVDVMDYKECVKQCHVGYCKKFNKEHRHVLHHISLEEKELK